jgi:hypothetical protein
MIQWDSQCHSLPYTPFACCFSNKISSRLVNATKEKGYQNIMSDQSLRVPDGNATCRVKSRDLEGEKGRKEQGEKNIKKTHRKRKMPIYQARRILNSMSRKW